MITPLIQEPIANLALSAPGLSARAIWQRQTRESAQSHAAFCTYLELGPNATLLQVAQKLGRSLESIRQLSSRHRWQERAAAQRLHTANATLAAVETQRIAAEQLWAFRLEAMRELQWERFQQLDQLCHEALNRLLQDPDPSMSIGQLIAFLRLASKFGHSAISGPAKQAARESAVPSIDHEIKLLTKLAKAFGADPEAHSAPELNHRVAAEGKIEQETLTAEASTPLPPESVSTPAQPDVPAQAAAAEPCTNNSNLQPIAEPEPAPIEQKRHNQPLARTAVPAPTTPIDELAPIVPIHPDLNDWIAIDPEVFRNRNWMIPMSCMNEPPTVHPCKATKSYRFHPDSFDLDVWRKRYRSGSRNHSTHLASN